MLIHCLKCKKKTESSDLKNLGKRWSANCKQCGGKKSQLAKKNQSGCGGGDNGADDENDDVKFISDAQLAQAIGGDAVMRIQSMLRQLDGIIRSRYIGPSFIDRAIQLRNILRVIVQKSPEPGTIQHINRIITQYNQLNDDIRNSLPH